jgi:hypothetical protein
MIDWYEKLSYSAHYFSSILGSNRLITKPRLSKLPSTISFPSLINHNFMAASQRFSPKFPRILPKNPLEKNLFNFEEKSEIVFY